MKEIHNYDEAVKAIKTAILNSQFDAVRAVNEKQLMLYYGIGKFLHTAIWSETEFVPNPPTKEMIPACEFRATYYSVHFFNWYHKAPTAELEEYLESMLLWGYNTIICILPIVYFENFDDPVFHELRTKTRIITKIDYEKIEYRFGCS